MHDNHTNSNSNRSSNSNDDNSNNSNDNNDMYYLCCLMSSCPRLMRREDPDKQQKFKTNIQHMKTTHRQQHITLLRL